MDALHLFTDGSYNPATKTGCGAYIAVTDTGVSPELLLEQVKVRRFENTTSVRLELETLLWAFQEVGQIEGRIIVYTDSQNIMSLPERHNRLEEKNYHSGKGRPLKNADLYMEFFRMTERLKPVFIKVQGHKTSQKKDKIDKLFTLVDRESRRALRNQRPL
ncbi:MAG: ribonuclease H [Deltaproteobacteria bacterium]|nr:ribonuclease H [Deltaproteobacteria bacterium]